MTTSWWSHSTSPYTPATNSADRLQASGLESLDAIWRFAEATKPLRHRDFVDLMRGLSNLSPRALLATLGGGSTEHAGESMAKRPQRQHQRRLNDTEVSDLLNGYAAGSTLPELATRFQVHHRTVAAILDRQGVKRRYKILGDEEIARARQLYEQGLSLVDVGSSLGVSAGTAHSALRAAGVKTRPVGTNQWQQTGRGRR